MPIYHKTLGGRVHLLSGFQSGWSYFARGVGNVGVNGMLMANFHKASNIPRQACQESPRFLWDEIREFLSPAFSLCRVIGLKLLSRTRLVYHMHPQRVSHVSGTIYDCLLPRQALYTTA